MKKITQKKKLFILLFILFLTGILFLINIFLFRIFLQKQIDDLHPIIPCDSVYLEKSDLIMAIPIYKNISIANYPGWCQEIKGMNKTIGMHGVYHTFNEFEEERDEGYVERGIVEFEKCFGFKPIIFEAPQWELSKENEILLNKMGFKIKKKTNALLHKVYHCSDEGEYGYSLFGVKITNKRVDLF